MVLRMDQAALDAGSIARGMVMQDGIAKNAADLEQELAWFAGLLDARFKLHFDQDCAVSSVFDLAPPNLSKSRSEYARFLAHYQLTFAERAAVVLALIPHIRPRLLDPFFTRNETFGRKFTEFGGHCDGSDGDFLPTGETLAFLLAGDDLKLRFTLQTLFHPQHFFAQHNILRLERRSPDPASSKALLRISEEHLSLFTTGQPRHPTFSVDFPAQHIETRLDWSDLVLHPGTLSQLEEISTWIEHGDTLMNDWGMAPKLRPGYRSLFHGPPGTGKTITACLLGNATGRNVYKVDLSLVISKYIGETEKNLAKVFDQAQHKGWILLFDEADALFGKRSETRDAHDRFANQEVSFLLQRIETFDGIAILASNLRENLDDAFARRFESVIYFPMPRPEERLKLWRQGFPEKAVLSDSLDIEKVAREHELSGGSVMNVIRYATLQALKDGARLIEPEDVLQGIRREYAKEGRVR